MIKFKQTATLALLASGLALSSPSWAEGYTFTDLGGLVGRTYSNATAINNAGLVTGNSHRSANFYNATLWDGAKATGQIFGTDDSSANAINNSGLLVGSTYIGPGSPFRATEWNSPITNNSNLGTWIGNGTYNTTAYGINSAGQVVGTSAVSGNFLATLWNGATTINLDTSGGGGSKANAINDSGIVVGSSNTIHKASPTNSEYLTTHATLWDGTTSTDLGTLGGTYSIANAINSAGLVVGFATTARDSDSFATLWNGTTATSLGTLVGGTYSQANAINSAGLVVGYSSFGGINNAHATLWDGTKATDLNSFLSASTLSAGWVLNQATGINDNGWIVGNASNSLLGITSDAFLLSTTTVSAVPVPAAVWLFASGLCLLGFTHRRNKNIQLVSY